MSPERRRFPRVPVALFLIAAAAACSSASEAPPDPASAHVAESLGIVNQVANQGRDFWHGRQMTTPPASTVADALNTFDARAREYLAIEACEPTSDFRNEWAAPNDDVRIGEHWSTDALAMMAFDGNCVDANGNVIDTPPARAKMVDTKLATYDTNGRVLGSTIDPVANYSRKGELDADLKDLMPILVRYRGKLSTATYEYMLAFLQQYDAGPYTKDFDEIHLSLSDFLNVGGTLGFALDEVSKIVAPVDYVAIPETENHMHMIHSTRFLANELLFAKTR